MKKMAPKKRKQGLPYERKGPSKGEKAPYIFLGGFSMGEIERPETHALVPSPWSLMSENDNKIN